MTAEQFTYWLQGFMEINDPETLNKRETQIIKDHLALVFQKETPTRVEIPIDFPNKTEIVTNPFEKGYPTVNPYISSPYPDWINRPTVYCTTNTSDTTIC